MDSQRRQAMLQMSFQLDVELAYLDLAIAKQIYKMRKQKMPEPRKPRKRRFWVRPWYLHRPMMGQFRLLMNDLRLEDEESFKNFTRMDADTFFTILARIQARIKKQDTFWREAISPAHRFAVALRYYATGTSYQAMHFSWFMGANTIGNIVRQVSEAIIEEYAEEEMNCPITKEGWLTIAQRFSSRWNYHHCLGALDGKHVAIKKPAHSGSVYHNYKKFFSVILMALVDAEYRFIWIDVGTPGSHSDAQIWNDCELHTFIKDQQLEVPEEEPLPGGDVPVPYFIVGDDAFALRNYLMKPYGRTRRVLTHAERVFNYRTSRARRIVENAFGILVNRWGCMGTTMRQMPEIVQAIVSACCILHNILRSRGLPRGAMDEEDANHQVIPGAWRDGVILADGEGGNRGNTGTNEGKDVRQYLTDYYVSPEGQVPWQDRMV